MVLSVAFLGVSIGGCGDLEMGPSVEIRSEDPVANFHFREALPSPESLTRRWASGEGYDEWVARWRSTWDEPGPDSPAERREAVEVMAALLASTLPSSALDQAFRQVDDAIRSAEAILGSPLLPLAVTHGKPAPTSASPSGDPASPGPRREAAPPREAAFPDLRGGEVLRQPGGDALEGSLVRAARHHALAEEAHRREDASMRLLHTLLAADELRGTTAGPLARTFLAQAEAELRRFSRDRSYNEVTGDRAERLLRGAHEALQVNQPALALQRAWYALGLIRAAQALDAPLVPPDDR
jgi:hypothetical protein